MGGGKISCSVDSDYSKAPLRGATTRESADDTKVGRLVLRLLVRSEVARDKTRKKEEELGGDEGRGDAC